MMTVDPQLQSEIARELAMNERLLWASRANPGRIARQAAPASCVGVPFLAFSIFWTVSATSMGAPIFFTLWGLMFCGIGAAVLLSPLWAAKKGSSTVYVVTDQRAMIIEGGSSRSIKSWTRRDIDTIERREHADGTGDVVFAREMRRGAKGRAYTNEIGFWGIQDARLVEGYLRQLAG
jgi:hypothetical protein